MKRVRDLFSKIISDENLRKAIQAVCDSHRWVHYPNKRNKTVVWIESDLDARVEELRDLIVKGFEPSPVIKKRMLRHCNHVTLYQRFVRKHTQKHSKNIVRLYYRKEKEKWTTSSDTLLAVE